MSGTFFDHGPRHGKQPSFHLPSLRNLIVPSAPVRVMSVALLASTLLVAPTATLRAQATATAAAASTPVAVTVVNAGTSPRQTLRYKLAAGSSEAVTMRQQMRMTMDMGGMAMPAQALPATVITTQVAVSDVAADGSASVTQEFVKVDLDAEGADPMLVNAMRPQLTAMQGVTMRYTISPTGQVSQLDFGAGAPEVLQAVQALASSDQLSVAFPTEAVGVGARWTAARAVTQSGLTVTQDVEYLVKSISPDSVVLEMSITQSAKDQVMDLAALPPGASARLRSLEGKGLSTTVIRFNRVQPSVDMTMNIKMALDLEMGGQSNAMNQTMVMEMKTVPAPAP